MPTLLRGLGFILLAVTANGSVGVGSSVIALYADVEGVVVDAISGTPVPRAVVTFVCEASSRATFVATDAVGRFRTMVPPCLYLIKAAAARYQDGGYGQRDPSSPLQPVELVDGSTATRLELRLWQLGSVTGLVHDRLGEPAVGVRVVALQEVREFDLQRFVRPDAPFATTDDRGEYRLTGLPSGNYLIGVPAANTLLVAGDRVASDWHHATTYYPSVESVREARLLSVSARTLTGIDLSLPDSGQTGRVIGRIVGESPGVTWDAQLLPADQDLHSDLDTRVAKVNAEGDFSFASVPAGEYVLRVTGIPHDSDVLTVGGARGPMQLFWPPNLGPGRASLTSPGEGWWGAEPVHLDESGEARVTLRARRGIRISGRLKFNGSSPVPTPAELVNNTIVFIEPSDGRVLRRSHLGRIGPSGELVTSSFPPGRYQFRVAGSPIWRLTAVEAEGAQQSFQELVLDEGTPGRVLLTLSDRTSSLSGTVWDRFARRARAAVVYLFPDDRRHWTAAAARAGHIQRVLSSTEGRYFFPVVPEGRFRLVAVPQRTDPESWTTVAHLAELFGSASTITVRSENAFKDLSMVDR